MNLPRIALIVLFAGTPSLFADDPVAASAPLAIPDHPAESAPAVPPYESSPPAIPERPCPCRPPHAPRIPYAVGTGTAVHQYEQVPMSWMPPVTAGVHGRYPYYSYRRPWYPQGPLSLNVTLVW